MKFLLIILGIKGVFHLVERLVSKKEMDVSRYEDGPSEHNVWW